MHVIYDGRVMAYQYTGLGRFTGELLFELLDMGREEGIKYTVIIWENAETDGGNYYYQKLRQYESNDLCRIISAPCRPISLIQHFCIPRFINRLDGDIYFYPHFDMPLSIRLPSVTVIHDLFPLKVHGYITKNPWLKILYFKLMLRVVARKAKFVFAVSETTRRDLLAEVGQNFSDKVGVSLEGPIVNARLADQNLSLSFTAPDKFLLYVGDRRPHKNLRRIIDLFILLRENALYSGSLLLIGSVKNHDFDVDDYVGSRSDIQIAGQVDDHSLAVLYQRMDALVFLSKYEGFGLPVVEAGLLGKKMIISDGGSIPEVAPPWAFVLPNDSALSHFVFQVGDYLEQPVMADENYAKRYTWNCVAQVVIKKFIEIVD